MSSSYSPSSVPRIQVFRPTMEEFKNFSKYIEKMESMGAHKAGLAKIIPPEEWCPRKGGYDDIDLMIPAPISQIVTGRQGLYQQYNIQQKALHVKEFQELAESIKYKTPPHFDYEDLERKYWKNITFNSPIYGADVSGSLYDDGVEEFNIQRLNTILDLVKEDYDIQIEGVNTAYLYFGMWKTTFAWHTEDMDLYSINYLHFGAPKSWYVVPPEHGRRLERLAAGFFHGSHQNCGAFLRHKMTIISPHILKKYSIPCSKITQEPGEFMITFPFGYHSGFNHGFNCAESTNFALPRWIEYGKRSSQCTCRNDCVKICMDIFVKKFQPDRYELWKIGKDVGVHPEDPSRHYAAPAPKKYELALSAKREEKKKQQRIKRHPVSKLKGSDNETSMEETEEKNDKTTQDSKSEDGTQNGKSSDSDSPPELKPFWQSEGLKAKQEKVEKEETVVESKVVKKEYDSSQAEFLDRFPKLKNAIDSGSVSIVFSEDSNTKLATDSMEVEETNSKKSENRSSCVQDLDLSATIFSLNWRCEQLNNGLKIKFVPPKKIESSSITSVSDFSQISVGECSVSIATSDHSDDETPPQLSSSSLLAAKSCISLNSSPKSVKRSKEKRIVKTKSKRSEEYKPKRDVNSKVNWAEPLIGLWRHEDLSFSAECKFNERFSSIPPHCAICVIFTPLHSIDFPSEPSGVPSFSVVKMPAFCYGNSLTNECILDINSLLRTDGTAPLLICSACKVCVHAPCYGVSMLPSNAWVCDRCSEKAADAECCLCSLRGGALKPTSDGRWAHVICGILIAETYFESTTVKQPIDVSGITTIRKRLKCRYCTKLFSTKDYHKGYCIQCQSGKCYLPFHATCGYMAGVIFETNDWPQPINTICTKHASARRKPAKRELTNVSVGESVVAKHKNRRYYWANVKKKYIQEYYSILFDDNSHSTNTLPEDIVSREVELHGPPQVNEKVRVKWTDGKIYNGIFKGSQSVEIYVIEFDDRTVLHQERKQIFAADEKLPKEVQSKMSHSSERRSLDYVERSAAKRSRINSEEYFTL